MDGMEDKISSILGNPEMMQKIIAMAQSLGTSQEPAPQAAPPPPPAPNMPPIDINAIQGIASLLGQSNIDKNQRALLNALTPYLSRERIIKLENAMRAAKLAGFASVALQQQGLPFLSGR